jgi:hypothetical protein
MIVEAMIFYLFAERVLSNPGLHKVVVGIGKGLDAVVKAGKSAAETVLDSPVKP